MLGQPVGGALVKKVLTDQTYFWGPLSDIEGKILPVLERNKMGDCLCLVRDKGLVDVHAQNVEVYIPMPELVDPMEKVLLTIEQFVHKIEGE